MVYSKKSDEPLRRHIIIGPIKYRKESIEPDRFYAGNTYE